MKRTFVTFTVAVAVACGVAHSARASQSASVRTQPALSLIVPRTAQTETNIQFTVRSAPHILVTLGATFVGQSYTASRRTGRAGRAHFVYSVPFSRRAGTIRVTAKATVHHRTVSTTKLIPVTPFVPEIQLDRVQVLRQTSDGWVPAPEAHRGDTLRFEAPYAVTELAGLWFPPCLSGSARLLQGQNVLATLSVQCPTSQPTTSRPYVYVDYTLPNTTAIGELSVRFDVTYDEGKYGTAKGSTSGSVSVIP